MKIMREKRRVVKRVAKKNRAKEKRIQIKSLFVLTKGHLQKWVWGLGVVVGLALIFLLPEYERMTLFNQIGLISLVILSVFVLFIYLARFWPEFLLSRPLYLLGILIVSMAVIGKVIIMLPQVSDYFIPIAFLSILVSLLFSPILSAITTLLLAILFAVNTQNLEILPILAVGGMVGSYTACFVHQRTDLTKGGLYVGISNVLAILAVGLAGNHSLSYIFTMSLWGMGSGFFSSLLVMLVLPYLETYFGITTDIRLLELGNLNLPLLNRLTIEAPGTYYHTIMVASLAEAGADAIGANSLLVRIGAYYHDIGKIVRPHFFFENGGSSKNNHHQKVTPNLSSVIIISHLKDGVEMAQDNRLPQVIIDIIREHHGTGLIAHFYREALLKGEEKNKELIEEENFRYPGPKPQSKEAAIVMLADSVEADFRFLPRRNTKSIETQVGKVVGNKLRDGQLDECDLTLREITKITQAFSRTLAGVVHTRGRYPEEMLKKESKIG
jgi:hypothetical protein